jgi:glycosyltransferase involved in cell wall biosynthesis
MIHRIYGYLLLGKFSLVRHLCNIAPFDVHIRGQLLDRQLSRIKADFGNFPPDILWVEHSYLYPIAENLKAHFPEVLLAINAHNVESELKRSVAVTHGTRLARKWGLQEAENFKAIERRMMTDSWFVSCCSREDGERFSKLAPNNRQRKVHLNVTPNGVDTDHFQTSRESGVRSGKFVIFTGTAGYPPNDQAVRWLVKEIWPKVRVHQPEAQLILAGRNASKYWLPLIEKIEGIQLYSDVADMRPLLSQASMAVVPIQSGSGTRLKILEAMSMEVPVASTSIGAEGLGLRSNEDILIGDTADALVKCICDLLEDNALQNKLAKNGRALAVKNFDWRNLCQHLIQDLETAWTES